MIKLYKYGFWILIVISITLFNLWNITKKGCETDNLKCKEINEKRISSLFASNSIYKRPIEFIKGNDIITNEINNNILKDTTLVILLTEPKCDRCQEKELRRLNILKEEEGINVIGITTQTRKYTIAIEMKTNKIIFPIYLIDDSTFYNKLSFDSEFPQILYIVDGIVISAFKPVPKDDEFSENYYKNLFSKIGN